MIKITLSYERSHNDLLRIRSAMDEKALYDPNVSNTPVQYEWGLFDGVESSDPILDSQLYIDLFKNKGD